MKTPVTVTLIYADATTWFAGQFNSREEAQAWVDAETTHPYWKQTTQVLITEVL